MSPSDWSAVWLTARLAALTTLILLVIATPLAWRLSRAKGRWRAPVEALVALPLVLPPTALGFYLLLLMSPNSMLGGWWLERTGGTLAFSFHGLLLASLVYSLPFAVQPLQNAFEAVGRAPMEAAASLRARPLDAFLTVAAPMAGRGYATAGALVFAHCLGEFGVLLMVGGNIPGRTRVISMALFEHVESLDYAAAHRLAGGLLLVSFCILLMVALLNGRFRSMRA